MPWPYRPAYPDAAQRLAEAEEAAKRIHSMGPQRRYRETQAEVDARFAEAMHHVASVAGPSPLTFICQINFAEVEATDWLDPDMPDSGLLSFFYDDEQQPWGYRSGDFAGSQLLFDASIGGKSRMSAPAPRVGSIGQSKFSPLRCEPYRIISVVPLGGIDNTIPKGDPDDDRFNEWYWEVLNPESGRGTWHDHRIGGHPTQIQQDMQVECQLSLMGLDPGDPAGFQNVEAHTGARNWLLLLQIASDNKNGMMWGDSGCLYVWILRDDLRMRRFDQAKVILQCY
jgi:hypothetical protein